MSSEVTEGNGTAEPKVNVKKDIEKVAQPLQEIDNAKKALQAVKTFSEPDKDEERSKEIKKSKRGDFVKDLFLGYMYSLRFAC